MAHWSSENETRRLEKVLTDNALGFSAAYMAVRSLNTMVREHSGEISVSTVSGLSKLLKDPKFLGQTQALAFYKEVSDTIAAVMVHSPIRRPFESAYTALKTAATCFKGVQQRAAAEAMGGLPLKIKGPSLRENGMGEIPVVPFNAVFKKHSAIGTGKPRRIGRSMVFNTKARNRILVIKQAHSKNALHLLNNEARWMDHLLSKNSTFEERFDVPMPCRFNTGYVFRLLNSPPTVTGSHEDNPCQGAIAFTAHKAYFSYPNAYDENNRLDPAVFKSVIRKNARIMGQMARMGIIHTAPIPLFHNRTQRLRRNDAGLYEWPRGGRLDQWLSSSQYPNFSLSGIRDFEHLVSFTGPDKLLYRHIGTHLMSFLLVTGSYFRNKAPQHIGKNRDGMPVDTRHLFDKPLFREIIKDVFRTYYKGFVEKAFENELPVNSDHLAHRLIDEMGCDRHMEEILRVTDQQTMSQCQFDNFLLRRGFSGQDIRKMKKGIADITIASGPHLGEFNGRISVPELIEFLAKTSAVCIADKFAANRRKDFS